MSNRMIKATDYDSPVLVFEHCVDPSTVPVSVIGDITIHQLIQVYHTDVRKLTSGKRMDAVDNDDLRPIFALSFNSLASVDKWSKRNKEHCIAIYTEGWMGNKQMFKSVTAQSVHNLMTFTAWLGHLNPKFAMPNWCTARVLHAATVSGGRVANIAVGRNLDEAELQVLFEHGTDAVKDCLVPPTDFDGAVKGTDSITGEDVDMSDVKGMVDRIQRRVERERTKTMN